jgi:hypothetical protein
MADDTAKNLLKLEDRHRKSTKILVCARQQLPVEMQFKHNHGGDDRMNDSVVPRAATVRCYNQEEMN